MTDILQEIDTFTEVHGAKGDGDLVSLLIRCRQEIEHLRGHHANLEKCHCGRDLHRNGSNDDDPWCSGCVMSARVCDCVPIKDVPKAAESVGSNPSP